MCSKVRLSLPAAFPRFIWLTLSTDSTFTLVLDYSAEYEYTIRTTIRHGSEYEANIRYIPTCKSRWGFSLRWFILLLVIVTQLVSVSVSSAHKLSSCPPWYESSITSFKGMLQIIMQSYIRSFSAHSPRQGNVDRRCRHGCMLVTICQVMIMNSGNISGRFDGNAVPIVEVFKNAL